MTTLFAQLAAVMGAAVGALVLALLAERSVRRLNPGDGAEVSGQLAVQKG